MTVVSIFWEKTMTCDLSVCHLFLLFARLLALFVLPSGILTDTYKVRQWFVLHIFGLLGLICMSIRRLLPCDMHPYLFEVWCG